MSFPSRKNIRLTEYDYSQPGAYFITICIKDRKPMLSRIVVGASIARPKEIHLTKYGQITETAIKNIPQHYPAISVDNYVIMPDHIHILLQIHSDNNGKPLVTQSIKKVIQQVKGIITKQIGFSMWQKGFYDHIVRCENDYLDIWQYIDNNPYKYN